MFIRAKHLLQFSRRDDLQNTGFDLRLKIVVLFGPVCLKAGGSYLEGSVSYNYRFHIVTRFKLKLQITDVIFSQCLQ